jgi:ribonuclease-3
MPPNLDQIALTHRSALNENKSLTSNERLEFLGDAVLELIVSVWLYHKFPQAAEGVLSLKRSQIVQTATLAQAAKKLQLDQKLILSKGEAKGGGRENQSILADCLEAVIGAIFLKDGLPAAESFVRRHILSLPIRLTDYKSGLQEKWQKRFHLAPRYRLLTVSGPDHRRTFQVGVYLNSRLVATGSGGSKHQAEAAAAKAALDKSV